MDRATAGIVFSGHMEKENLTETEIEIALNILNNLEGTLVIRATSILKFCLKAVQYSKIKS